MTAFLSGSLNTVLGDPGLNLAITILIKASIILVAGMLMSRLLHRYSASFRHWVWRLTLLALLVMPFFTNVVPKWNLEIVPNYAVEVPEIEVSEVPAQNIQGQMIHEPAEGSYFLAAPDNRSGLTPIMNLGPDGAPVEQAEETFAWWMTWIQYAWLGIAGAFMLRLIAQMACLAHLYFRSDYSVSPELEQVLDQAKNTMDVRSHIKLGYSKNIQVPMTFGVTWQVILLPEVAKTWKPEKLRMVLLHELAHVIREDFIVNIISYVMCSFYWFNPLVWFADRKLRIEAEHACDDLVIQRGISPTDYAVELLEIARNLNVTAKPVRVSPLLGNSELKQRLTSILDAKASRRSINAGWSMVSMVLIMPFLFAVSGARLAETPLAQQVEELNQERRVDSGMSSDALIDALNSANADERIRAAWALGSRKDQIAVPQLMNLLVPAEDPSVKSAAIWALGEIRDYRSLWAITPIMKNDNIERSVRMEAIQAVGKYGLWETFGPLDCASYDDDPEIRKMITWAFGEIGTFAAYGAVSRMMRDENPEVRATARATIKRFDSEKLKQQMRHFYQNINRAVRKESAYHAVMMKRSGTLDDFTLLLSDGDKAASERMQHLLQDMFAPTSPRELANML